ncbi:MAG: acyl carrier protein [Chloroflexota bacterium]
MSNEALGNIETVIKEFIAEEFMFDRPASDLSNDMSLIQEGIIDSLGIFMLVSFIDNQFGVKVEPEDVVLDNFETINKIKDLIAARQ